MSILFARPIFAISRTSLFLTHHRTARSNAPKKAKGLQATPAEPPTLESRYLDPQPDLDLGAVCYGLNYFSAGEEVGLKDASEYPDWLWTLLDPVPKDPSNSCYARRLRKSRNRAKQKELFYDKRWPGWKKYYPPEE